MRAIVNTRNMIARGLGWQTWFEERNIKDFGARGDGVTDDTAAFLAALEIMPLGGQLYLPRGTYLTSQTLYVPRSCNIRGDGKLTSVIKGVHTGAAVLSFKGVSHCSCKDFGVEGDTTTIPKTGLCLGRAGAGSAGYHYFEGISTHGSFSEAAVYLIASEENIWQHCYFALDGGAALATVYTSQSDDLAVDTLVGSSNNLNAFHSCQFYNPNDIASSTALHMATAAATSMWAFRDCYFVVCQNAFVTITVGVVAANSCDGPIVFDNCSGEKYYLAGGNVTYGLRIIQGGPYSLQNLAILHEWIDDVAGGGAFSIYSDNDITLDRFTIQTTRAVDISVAHITNSHLDVPYATVTIRTSIDDQSIVHDDSGFRVGSLLIDYGIDNDLIPNADDTYALGLFGIAWDRLVVMDTTNGRPYKIETINGVVTATDLFGEFLGGYWKMNDNAANTTVTDDSGNANTGTAQRNTNIIHDAGLIGGGALTFASASSDYVAVTAHATLNWGAGDGSVCLWFKRNGQPGSVEDLLINGSKGSGQTRFYLLINTDGTITFSLDDNTTVKNVQGGTDCCDNAWHCIVAMRDGTDIRLFVDSVEDATPVDIGAYGNLDSGVGFTIGAGNDGAGVGTSNYFDGIIDATYNFPGIAITQDTINWLYNSGSGREPT
jgi:hypothetical protein